MADYNKIKELDDTTLIQRFVSTNDNAYVGVLFERYIHLILGVCMKYLKDEDEAKDAVMVIFENLLVNLKKHKITYFKAWLHTVAKNHCFMILRKSKREVTYVGTIHVENMSEIHQEDKIETEQKLVILEEAIKELDKHQQTCIRLFYLEEKSYQQITDITGFDFKKVKSFIQNGKRNLKIIMENNESR